MSEPAAEAKRGADTLADEIGRSYDAMPYDPEPAAALSLARIYGALVVLGQPSPGAAPEVLDIGCGGGVQLLLAAQQGASRLVGIDASASACVRARARGECLGDRWQILEADAAAVDPAKLGRFDVIYLLGTLYIMPPVARARALALLASCLKPGGVAVVNYYTGITGLVRTRLGRVLRMAGDPGWPLAQQLATARANLQTVADAVPVGGPTRELVLATIASMQDTSDTVLFHEALGPVYDAVHTSEVEATLAGHGLAFLNYLPPIPTRTAADSAVAARTADAWDFASGGGFRTVLFRRPMAVDAPEQALVPTGLRHAGVVWSTGLQPAAQQGAAAQQGETAQKEAVAPGFEMPGRGGIQAHTPVSQAILECLIAQPRRWAELRTAALAWLAARGAMAPSDDEVDGVIDELLILLWQNSLGWPERRAAE